MAEIPTYTLEQLAGLNLPGYCRPAMLPEIADPHTDWTPVLSLSILRQNPDDPSRTQLLTGVRHNTTTHDGVVSTPTGQIPRHIQPGLLSERQYFLSQDYQLDMLGWDAPVIREVGVLAFYRPHQEPLSTTSSVLSLVAQEVMRRKLSYPPADASVDTQLGTISLTNVLFGFSYVDDDPTSGEPLYEALVMYGAAIILSEAGAALLPEENQKYKYLGWTEDSKTFGDDVRNKDVFKLTPTAGINAVEFCARGLCLATSSWASVLT
ncbi:MAG: hypothetical protein JWM81_359 [Candidatus Saccharibacteria bacterium]|nr:hypothetical protein [Candidatus Saccharibacteria bacterium]